VQDTHKHLRLNVGFLINQSVGTSRDFLFDIPHIHLEPDLNLGDLSGFARVSRTAQGLLVQVKMRATFLVECVRCLLETQLPLQVDFTELYTFLRNSNPGTDLVLPENAQIDLAPLLREYMILEVPINPLCSPDCQGICPICGENLNITSCDHPVEVFDSPLAGLQSLLDGQETT
jgi:uncharacterized protein